MPFIPLKNNSAPSLTEFMADPEGCWPNYPILPVKRGNPFEKDNLGFILADHPLIIFLSNIFEMKMDKMLIYPEVATMEENGWLVD